MAAPTYRDRIQHIPTGAPGRASSVSQPDRQLESNIQYLKAVYDAAELGEAMFIWDQVVEEEALVGMPVYWNYSNGRFERALAAVVNNSGVIEAADSADVAGIVASKSAPSIAHIMTLGVAAVDITEAVDGTPVAGRYYLSAAQAGKLVAQSPPATVLVLRNYGDGRIQVATSSRIMAQDHQHISLELVAAPAGTCAVVTEGETQTIIAPDENEQGWLPAAHSSFNGNAPEGADFGYNIAADPTLSALWPPVPVEAVVIEMLRSDTVNGQKQVYGRVSQELVQFDINGIWWMSNCYNEAPWPVDCSTSTSQSSLSACPTSIEMALILSFVRMTFHTG